MKHYFLILLSALLHLSLSVEATSRQNKEKWGLPIECTMGKNCWLQYLPDHGYGTDATCAQHTYKGHNGTDIRTYNYSDVRKGVYLLAPRAGKVVKIRNTFKDTPSLDRSDVPRSKGCGNLVEVKHSDGWTSRLCHVKQHSFRVRVGDTVKKGQRIAKMGMSGNTQFPHVHLTVRDNDRNPIDPFTGTKFENRNVCTTAYKTRIPSQTLWDSVVSRSIMDTKEGLKSTRIVSSGVITDITQLKNNTKKIFGRINSQTILGDDWKSKGNNKKLIKKYLLFWASVANLRKNDKAYMQIIKPGANNKTPQYLFRRRDSTAPEGSIMVYDGKGKKHAQLANVLVARKFSKRTLPSGTYKIKIYVMRKKKSKYVLIDRITRQFKISHSPPAVI